MIIPKALLKICSTDSTRYAITHVYVDVDQGCAIATDGYKLVYYPIEPEKDVDVSGYVPKDAILAAATNKPFCGMLLHREKETTVPCKGVFPNPYSDTQAEPPQFPDWETIISYPKQGYHTISFNARSLADIAAVLSDRSIIVLHYNPEQPLSPLHVTADKTNAMAMLMPVRHDAHHPTMDDTP